MYHPKKTGFTLVEVLFVLVIVAAVMAFAVPSYKRTKDRAAYDAATGILVDLGNAVQAMKRDLMMQNYPYNFPTSANYQEFPGSVSTIINPAEKTLRQYIESRPSSSEKDNAFKHALYIFNYLEPVYPKNYKYYVVRNNVSANICNSKCTASNLIVCMCKPDYSASDCYYGAMFLSTGDVKRLEGSSCRS